VVDRVTQAVGVGVDAPRAEGAQAVRAGKAHQRGAVGPVAVAEVIGAADRVAALAVEARQVVAGVAGAVGGPGVVRSLVFARGA